MPAQSRFGQDIPLAGGTVTISDREHNIYVSEQFTRNEGGRTVTSSFWADGPQNKSIHSPDVKSKAKWDGDRLVVTFTENEIPTVERCRLASDGSLVMTMDKPGHPTETLVFTRQ